MDITCELFMLVSMPHRNGSTSHPQPPRSLKALMSLTSVGGGIPLCYG
jgi:hypothetical protein